MIIDDTHLDNILGEIGNERLRQEKLKHEGRFKYTCADKEITHLENLAVLTEEFGEAAHDVNEAIGGHTQLDVKALRTELIQIAAVCAAWVEKIDNER